MVENRHHSVLSEQQQAPPLPGGAYLELTRWLMLLERNLRYGWRFYCVIGLFLSCAWFDLFAYLPGPLHLLALAVFAAAALLALRGTAPGWRLPSLTQAARRLEEANAIHHRPYEALTARPVNLSGDALVKTLWREHQRRARALLTRLRLPRPQFSIDRRDPHALRLGILLLFGAALMSGWHELGARLERALTPQQGAVSPLFGPSVEVTAWITPPAYTGLPPLMLAEAGKPPAGDIARRVPAGSKLAVRVNGGEKPPRLLAGEEEAAFQENGAASYTFDGDVPAANMLKIKAGWSTLARWPIEIVADAPPEVAWGEQPRADKQGVQLDYHVRDDYRVTQVEAVVNLAVSAPGLPTLEQRFPINGAGQKEMAAQMALPLATNVWAGMPVTIMVEATDQAGQSGRTPTATLTLPEHQFTDPLAKQLAAARRDLLRDSYGHWKPLINWLVATAEQPEKYRGNPRILLGLRSTAVRMYLDQERRASLTPVATTLWQMALSLDTNGMAEAEENLRNAQRQLEEALASKADAGAIKDKTEKMQQALLDYMQALAKNLPPEAQDIPQDLMDDASQEMAQDLMRKAEEIRDLAQTGAHEAAAQKLLELQKMLDQLQQAKPMSPEQQADMQALKKMRELIQKQEKLQEQTRQTANGAPPPPPAPEQQDKPEQQQDGAQQDSEPQAGEQQRAAQQPGQPQKDEQQSGVQQQAAQVQSMPGAGPGGEEKDSAGAAGEGKQPAGSLAQQQGQLRRDLGQMIDDLASRHPQPPSQMGAADQGMKAAGQKLEQQQWREAGQEQGKTLQALKDMANSLKKQLQSQMILLPSGGGGEGRQRNPFSHGDDKEGGGDPAGKVKIPEQQDVQRARKILDELRRRSGEYERPKDERGYIERLLNKF